MGEITEGMTRGEMEFVIYGMSLADWLAQREANVVDSDPHRWNGLTYEDDPSPVTPPKDRTSGWSLTDRGYLGRLR